MIALRALFSTLALCRREWVRQVKREYIRAISATWPFAMCSEELNRAAKRCVSDTRRNVWTNPRGREPCTVLFVAKGSERHSTASHRTAMVKHLWMRDENSEIPVEYSNTVPTNGKRRFVVDVAGGLFPPNKKNENPTKLPRNCETEFVRYFRLVLGYLCSCFTWCRGRYPALGHFLFSNFFYFSQKFEKIKMTIRKSDNVTMYGNFCLNLY